MKLIIDEAQSAVTIDLFAEGWLAALAHDLRLELRGLQGSAERAPGGAVEGQGSARVSTQALRVLGALERGVVNERKLSVGDQREIERRATREHLGDGELALDATLRGGALEVRARGPRSPRPVQARWSARAESRDGALWLEGEGELSLGALGVGKIQGPARVFKMRDAAKVRFRVRFVPSDAPASGALEGV